MNHLVLQMAQERALPQVRSPPPCLESRHYLSRLFLGRHRCLFNVLMPFLGEECHVPQRSSLNLCLGLQNKTCCTILRAREREMR